MPATKKITRDLILEGAMSVFRKHGFDCVNARSIAKEINCSTQPIYVEFTNMEELKTALSQSAKDIHNNIIKHSLSRSNGFAYQAYGIAFVSFAMKEKMLFRYLYLDGGDRGKEIDNEHFDEVIKVIQKECDYTRNLAEQFHRDMSIYTFGLAMIVNSGYHVLAENEIKDRLDIEFKALSSVYGLPSYWKE